MKARTQDEQSGAPVVRAVNPRRRADSSGLVRTVPEVVPVVQVAPRLLDLEGAARYLGNVSAWTIRDYVAGGHLTPVRLPGPREGDLRRILLDIRDLDRLIDEGKAP